MTEVDTGRDFSGTLTEFVLRYLREQAPAGTLDEVLRAAGETRSPAALGDGNTWSTYRQYRNLLEAAGRALGGSQALATVGAHIFDAIVNPELIETLRALGSPTAVYETLSAMAESTAPAVDMTIVVTGPHECHVELRMRAPHEPFREACVFQLGLLAAIPEIFGYPPAEVLDEVCQSDGAPCCSVRLTWSTADEYAARMERAELRARLSEARLDGLQHTVAELVSGDGLERVLSRVMAAAKRAVIAPAFVLDVLPSGTFDRLVHVEGLDEVEGARLTRRIRSSGGTDPEPHVAVSEVVSERGHYGHLVAVRSEGVSFQPPERSFLDAYAGLAASALDTEAAITDAHRQAAAAQALLALSSSLADLASSEEMVGRLARALPSVIDCDGVVVSLTESGDEGDQTVRVHAVSGFDDATAAELRSLEIPMPPWTTGLARHRTDGDRISPFSAVLAAAGSLRVCSFPIASGAEMFGWITIAVTSHPERLDDDAALTERLRGLAGQAAIAIRNSRLLDEIRHRALHDDLTGLPNRALIVDRVTQALARSRRDHLDVALLFVDLDGFKDVNDTLGHGIGDELLQSVAARFVATLRVSDTVARLGGDEFVVLAEGLSLAAGPELVAERLLSVLAEPFALGDGRHTVSISASIGIATGQRDNAEDLFTDADVALYAAKDAGKSRYVVFEAHMGDALRSRHEIEMDLQAAVGTEQLFLVYQPIFDLSDMAVIGVEALLRWNHPARGLLHPDEFIPALEASGLSLAIGRWVLIEACRQGMRWQAHGRATNVSVNASGRQFDSGGLPDDVRDALLQSGLSPRRLTLEITETSIMRDTKATLRQLSALKALGVRIAIDDFGTGYSSLAYLQQFPVDSLKIDRSFISGMAESPAGEALIHTLIRLGQALNIETVAEGVDQPGQLTQLQAERCATGQGYLLSRPLPPDEVEKLLRPTPDMTPSLSGHLPFA